MKERRWIVLDADVVFRLKKECKEYHNILRDSGLLKTTKYKHWELLLDKILVHGSLDTCLEKVRQKRDKRA